MDDLYNIFSELYDRRNSLSHSDKEFIKTTYLDRYNGRMSKTCNQAYADAITHILIRLRVENKTFTTMEKSNYLLKNGVIINSAEYGIVANGNITDEIAEKYLKKFPHQIVKFSVYPQDWQDRLEREAESAPMNAEMIEAKIAAMEADIEILKNMKKELAESTTTSDATDFVETKGKVINLPVKPETDESQEQTEAKAASDETSDVKPKTDAPDYDESQLIDAIRQLLKNGRSKTQIRKLFLDATLLGKKITGTMMGELLNKATE